MAEEKGEMEMAEMEVDEENLARFNSQENDQQSMRDLDVQEHAEPEQEDQDDLPELEDLDDVQEEMQVTPDCEDRGDEHNEETSDTTSDSIIPRLFIGGLNSVTTDSDLRKHFEKYGELTECSVARRGRDVGKNGKSRGFGFVTMATMAETEAVLKDTHVVNDKVVAAMVSRPPDVHVSEKKLRLRVKDLDIERTTEETLAAHFGQFGTVAYCNISKEQVDGKVVSRGIGFVTMTTEEEVQDVLNGCIDGHQSVDGKSVNVRWVAGTTQNHDRLRKLWFGGLDKNKTSESDMMEYFSTFGTVVDCVIIREPPETESGECRSKGYGFITMATVEETNAILKHTGQHKIHSKKLVFNRVPLPPLQNDYDQPIKAVHVFGLKNAMLTADDLRTYFNTHSNVRNVTMIKDEGAARILLGRASDAEKLAHMQDHCVKNVWLSVRLADPQSATRHPEKAAKQKQSLHKKVRGSGSSDGNPGQQLKSSKRHGSTQGNSRQTQGQRQTRGFSTSGGRGLYRNQPVPGGYLPPRQSGMADYYYEADPSGYGPVRGRGPSHSTPRGRVQSHGGGSVGRTAYVDSIYRELEQKVPPRPFQLTGFIGRGRGSVLSMGVGYSNEKTPGGRFNDTDGLGGGYDDDWGEGGSMTRGRGRGRGRGWRPY